MTFILLFMAELKNIQSCTYFHTDTTGKGMDDICQKRDKALKGQGKPRDRFVPSFSQKHLRSGQQRRRKRDRQAKRAERIRVLLT